MKFNFSRGTIPPQRKLFQRKKKEVDLLSKPVQILSKIHFVYILNFFWTKKNFKFVQQLHFAHRGFCRFRDDTAADFASSRKNAASLMRENAGSPRVRFTNFPDITLSRGVGLCVY